MEATFQARRLCFASKPSKITSAEAPGGVGPSFLAITYLIRSKAIKDHTWAEIYRRGRPLR